MIQRFVIGKPFPTESVVLDLPAETGPVPYLTPDGDGWQYVMQEKDIVYGLGEMPRGLNKRGWHYETNNTDESEHGENRLSYYAAHNFLLISPADGSECIGIFVDFPGKVSYDIGYTRHDTLRFATAEPNYALYLITAPAAAEVAKEFRQLIGPSYIPPKWAFGLAQSRFGYKTEADIREVAAQYKANGLPLDNNGFLHLDISGLRPAIWKVETTEAHTPGTDASLNSLSLGSLSLSPAFAGATTTYTASTTNATNVVTAVPADASAAVKVTVNDKQIDNGSAATWNAGSNTVKVVVTAEDGTTTKTYTVTVTKS